MVFYFFVVRRTGFIPFVALPWILDPPSGTTRPPTRLLLAPTIPTT